MDRADFEKIDPLLDQLAGELEGMLQHPKMEQARELIAKTSRILGERYSVNLEIQLQVVDSERESTLPLLQVGLSSTDGEEPYLCSGDSSPHRYVVDGNVVIVPHDRCPGCWGEWDFKELQPTCPECGISMGKQVLWLLDNDRCPNCEETTISAAQPTCSRCGHSVNPNFIRWG